MSNLKRIEELKMAQTTFVEALQLAERQIIAAAPRCTRTSKETNHDRRCDGVFECTCVLLTAQGFL
ncbi:hypothetical protein EYF80_021254 [Liparis tanakae]|uniref:Uncharacterized protein n=1 Tax=Liparis tanakae TaxID=230148 RepID=A0A4Z2HRK4_9TELE|nr:hypothetical protein EYF80_021254 [Liparis tanakae]